MHHYVFLILGLFGQTLGEQFYAQSRLVLDVTSIVCCGIDHIPNEWLIVVMRFVVLWWCFVHLIYIRRYCCLSFPM